MNFLQEWQCNYCVDVQKMDEWFNDVIVRFGRRLLKISSFRLPESGCLKSFYYVLFRQLYGTMAFIVRF